MRMLPVLSAKTVLIKPVLSIVITAKSKSDKLYQELLESIRQQTYPKSHYEIITVTEGDSESAKAIGLRKARGEIVGIFASDNYLDDPNFLKMHMLVLEKDKTIVAVTQYRYSYMNKDNLLNRYFSLMCCNDPIAFYLDKNDKWSYAFKISYKEDDIGDCIDISKVRTWGDNGFFIRKDILMKADIEHYYHIDVCQDLFDKGYRKYAMLHTSLWHRTGGNIFKFFYKRFKYADKFMDNRRWHMVEKQDLPRLALFIIESLLLFPLLIFSIRGYTKIRDKAWFLHLPVCLLTIITYGLLCIKRLFYRVCPQSAVH